MSDKKTKKDQTKEKTQNKKASQDQAVDKTDNETAKKLDSENEQEAIEVPEIQEVEVEDPNLIRIAEEDNPKAHWYVVHTYSGRENRVAETLKQRAQTLNLTDKIIKVLIPTKEKIQIKKGQRKKVTEKIFPGYMLVNMLMSDDAWLAVRTTQGVTGFVGTSSKPSPIPTHEVEAIRSYTQQATPQYKAEFTEGQAVKITDGPFTEFLGTVQSIDEEKGQVEVLINIFGRETPVELDFLQVEKV
jgi:transcriptional antiterminator NusG